MPQKLFTEVDVEICNYNYKIFRNDRTLTDKHCGRGVLAAMPNLYKALIVGQPICSKKF